MTDADRPDETPEDRVPCSDDMCVGIIGPNGKCGVCGRPGTPPPQRPTSPHPHDDLHEDSAGKAEPAPAPAPEPEPATAATDPDDRVPCLDDMCVGILSSEGKCGTCGKTWPGFRPG